MSRSVTTPGLGLRQISRGGGGGEGGVGGRGCWDVTRQERLEREGQRARGMGEMDA